ncbi:MAG: DNA-formamidopyrimidine glycosylase family protein [Candidatus Oleimicrobiaceae bacterium]
MAAPGEALQQARNAAEVAIWCGQLRACAVGKKIVQAAFPAAHIPHLPPYPHTLLCGSRVAGVRRVAACLLLDLDTRLSLVLQFAGGGSMRWLEQQGANRRHEGIVIRFQEGTRLLVGLPAPEAAVLVPTANAHRLPPLKGLGADVLSADFDMSELRATLARSSGRLVRTLLLDPRRIAGLDDQSVDEILLHARLHPRAKAGHLTLPQQRALLEATRVVLHMVLDKGGSATTGFADLYGKRGEFRAIGWDACRRTCWRCGSPLASTLCGRQRCFVCPICQEPPPRSRTLSHRYHREGGST